MYAIRSYYGGAAYTSLVDPDESIELPSTPGQGSRRAQRELLAHIIHQRLDEVFGMVVITSYSIHYTKLYERISGRRRIFLRTCTTSTRKRSPGSARSSGESPTAPTRWRLCWRRRSQSSPAAGKRSRKGISMPPSVSRITSYNVCYTKLLRRRRRK